MKYLGFVINKKGLQIDPEKIKPIKEFSKPKTAKQLQRFIGMASWYRRFMSHFSDLIEPLGYFTSNISLFSMGL